MLKLISHKNTNPTVFSFPNTPLQVTVYKWASHTENLSPHWETSQERKEHIPTQISSHRGSLTHLRLRLSSSKCAQTQKRRGRSYPTLKTSMPALITGSNTTSWVLLVENIWGSMLIRLRKKPWERQIWRKRERERERERQRDGEGRRKQEEIGGQAHSLPPQQIARLERKKHTNLHLILIHLFCYNMTRTTTLQEIVYKEKLTSQQLHEHPPTRQGSRPPLEQRHRWHQASPSSGAELEFPIGHLVWCGENRDRQREQTYPIRLLVVSTCIINCERRQRLQINIECLNQYQNFGSKDVKLEYPSTYITLFRWSAQLTLMSFILNLAWKSRSKVEVKWTG